MKKYSYFDVLGSLIVMLFIISLAVILTLNFKQLYYFDIGFLNIPESSGLSEEVIRENYDVLIDYNSMFNSDELEFPSLAMSETGKIHFEEVKEIFVMFQYFFVFTIFFTIGFVIYKIKKKSYNFFKLTAIFTVVIPTVLGTLIGLNWNWFFIKFHQIAFDNDYWIFDPASDPVITILPDAFFMHAAIMILAIALILSGICLGCYSYFSKKT